MITLLLVLLVLGFVMWWTCEVFDSNEHHHIWDFPIEFYSFPFIFVVVLIKFVVAYHFFMGIVGSEIINNPERVEFPLRVFDNAIIGISYLPSWSFCLDCFYIAREREQGCFYVGVGIVVAICLFITTLCHLGFVYAICASVITFFFSPIIIDQDDDSGPVFYLSGCYFYLINIGFILLIGFFLFHYFFK